MGRKITKLKWAFKKAGTFLAGEPKVIVSIIIIIITGFGLPIYSLHQTVMKDTKTITHQNTQISVFKNTSTYALMQCINGKSE